MSIIMMNSHNLSNPTPKPPSIIINSMFAKPYLKHNNVEYTENYSRNSCKRVQQKRNIDATNAKLFPMSLEFIVN